MIVTAAYSFQDEVLVASDRIVLKLDDLVTWITEEVEWNHGILAPQCKPAKDQDPAPAVEDVKKEEAKEEDEVTVKEEKKDEKDEKEVTKEEKAVVVKDELNQGAICIFFFILLLFLNRFLGQIHTVPVI